MDPDHSPLDYGDLGVSDLWSLSRRALGLLGAGMGRVLGLGSRRERFADAMAHRDRIPALGHDAGKAGHAEDLEHVADFFHLHALDFRHVSDSQRSSHFGAFFFAIFEWRL